MRIKDLSPMVYDLLDAEPVLRESDALLYNAICLEINPYIKGMTFQEVMLNLPTLGLPTYDSVGRARRKIQGKFPRLRASEKVTDKRYEKFKEVLEDVSD